MYRRLLLLLHQQPVLIESQDTVFPWLNDGDVRTFGKETDFTTLAVESNRTSARLRSGSAQDNVSIQVRRYSPPQILKVTPK